jgi:hypothetical protein
MSSHVEGRDHDQGHLMPVGGGEACQCLVARHMIVAQVADEEEEPHWIHPIVQLSDEATAREPGCRAKRAGFREKQSRNLAC